MIKENGRSKKPETTFRQLIDAVGDHVLAPQHAKPETFKRALAHAKTINELPLHDQQAGYVSNQHLLQEPLAKKVTDVLSIATVLYAKDK